MMKKLLLTCMFVLPLGIGCDQPTQAELTKRREEMRAAWDSMSQKDREAMQIEQEIYQLCKSNPQLRYADAKIMIEQQVAVRKEQEIRYLLQDIPRLSYDEAKMMIDDGESYEARNLLREISTLRYEDAKVIARDLEQERKAIEAVSKPFSRTMLAILKAHPTLSYEEAVIKAEHATPEQLQQWLDAEQHGYLIEEIIRNRITEERNIEFPLQCALLLNPTLSYQKAKLMVKDATPEQRQAWTNAYYDALQKDNATKNLPWYERENEVRLCAIVLIKNPTLSYQQIQPMIKNATPEQREQWRNDHYQEQAAKYERENDEERKYPSIVVALNPDLDTEQAIRMIKQATPRQRQEWLGLYEKREQQIQKIWQEQDKKYGEVQEKQDQLTIILIQNPGLGYQDALRMIQQATPEQRKKWIDECAAERDRAYKARYN